MRSVSGGRNPDRGEPPGIAGVDPVLGLALGPTDMDAQRSLVEIDVVVVSTPERSLEEHRGVPPIRVELGETAVDLIGIHHRTMDRTPEFLEQPVQFPGSRVVHDPSTKPRCYTTRSSAGHCSSAGGAVASVETMTSIPTCHPLPLAEWRRAEPLTGDASPRRYTRLWNAAGRSAILVEYPRAVRSQFRRDLEVFSWCREGGLKVPDILLVDFEAGRALLEDLGPTDVEATLEATPARERKSLLERLLDPLEILARYDPADLPPWNPPLGRERLRWELAGFELWFVRHYRGRAPSPGLHRWLDELAVEVGNHPLRVCHRDFHFNNLLIRDDGGVGVIDIQDILVGPDTYDVVSLVGERAATRLISMPERLLLLEEWAHRTGAEPGWPERARSVQIQRGLKVLGSFARFTQEGRTEYRRWLMELAGRLAEVLDTAGAPRDVTAFLLD